MADDGPGFLRELESEAAEAAASIPTEEGQARLRKMASRMLELQTLKNKLEKELKDTNVELWDLQHKHMVDLMNEVGIDRLGLADSEMDLVLAPYYKANIVADWPEEQRQAAFQHLDDLGLGDIVKNTITIVFPRGHDDEKQEWLEKVRALNLSFDPPEMIEDRTVPWNTLTSTVKEQVESGKHLNDDGTPRMNFDLLGATVGQEVKLKKRK